MRIQVVVKYVNSSLVFLSFNAFWRFLKSILFYQFASRVQVSTTTTSTNTVEFCVLFIVQTGRFWCMRKEKKAELFFHG